MAERNDIRKYSIFNSQSSIPACPGQEVNCMGKGDIRTKRGKIWRGTTGKTRPKKIKKKEQEK